MEVPKIEKLHELLKPYLEERKITSLDTKRLTAMGENYGSEILALSITLDNNEVVEAVAKIPPPGEFMQRMFNTRVTFKNEIDFYQKIVPELKQFVEKKGHDLDCFPEFISSRLTLDPDETKVDDNAVLVLENLKVQGYEMIERTIGFDHQTSILIIKTLAKCHAIPLAMKLVNPDVFESKIRSFFKPYTVFAFDDAMFDLVIQKNRAIVEEIPGCEHYAPRVVDAFKATQQPLLKSGPELIREPFATIIHTDVWVNNFMIKFQDGVPISCKIVDFQLDEYGSPLRDLIFFLFTSVQIQVLREHYEELVDLYRETFLEILDQLGCDTTPFSVEEFEKEIETVVKQYEFLHCMIMLQPIYASKKDLKELADYSEEDLTKVLAVPPKMKERAAFIVQEFAKRNWI